MTAFEKKPPTEAGAPDRKALVVLPTYNEKENIRSLVEEILALPIASLQVLVVDDNSPDGTAEIVQKMAETEPRLHLLRRPAKLGLGTAHGAGFDYGLQFGFAYVVTMDADFSHHPRYLPAILRAAPDYDLVIGSRYIKGGGTENWPWHRRVLSAGSNLMTRLTLGVPAHDCTGAYRCYSRKLLETVDWRSVRARGYSFMEEMLFRVVRAGCSVGEVPIVFADRQKGTTKINKAEILKAIGTLFYLGLERASGRKPK